MTNEEAYTKIGDAVRRSVDLAPLKNKSVLLLGGRGLIGSALAWTLGSHAIVACPRRRTSIDGYADRADYIIHAAGYGQPAKFMADPLGTIEANTTLLLQCVKPGARVLYLSTSELYSGSSRTLHTEDDIGTTKPSHPRASYIEAKRCGEAICHAANAHGGNAVIARVSLVYGPGVRRDDTRVMSDFMASAARGEGIRLKDGGAARRTYCYLTDAVEMLLNILISGKHTVYNVGGIGEISIYGLARKIADIAGVTAHAPRNMGEAVAGAPSHVGLDISRYQREFEKEQFVPLEQGLRETLEWHRMLEGTSEKAAA